MFNTLKELPLRVFTRTQVALSAATEEAKSTSILPSNKEQRAGLVAGGLFATAAYGASVPAMAAGVSGFTNVMYTFTKFAMILVGSASVLMAVAAGLMFVTSAGNSRMISRAKDTIKYVVVGMMLVGGMWILREVVSAVVDPSGKDSLNKTVKDSGNAAAQGSSNAPLK